MTLLLSHSQEMCDDAELARITGAAKVKIIRFRSRPRRQVLHVSLQDRAGRETGQGAIWFFDGQKANRVAKRHRASVFDHKSGVLFDRFPADHRLPEIADYLHWIMHEAPEPLRATSTPQLLRYRPGLCCTFRVIQQDGQEVFTKVIAKEDVALLAKRQVPVETQDGQPVTCFASPIRAQPEFRAITYEKAEGTSLESRLRKLDVQQSADAVELAANALRGFASDSVATLKFLSPERLLERAKRAVELVADRDGYAAQMASELLERIAQTPPSFENSLIHGDMKTDHVFLSSDGVTFIDSESMAMGDRRYDLACLEVSIMAGTLRRDFPNPLLTVCREHLRRVAGPGYDWFLNVARLKLARHFAQRPGAKNVSAMIDAMTV